MPKAKAVEVEPEVTDVFPEEVEEEYVEPTILEKLFDLEEPLREALPDLDPFTQVPIVNILGDLSHLRDVLHNNESLKRPKVS